MLNEICIYKYLLNRKLLSYVESICVYDLFIYDLEFDFFTRNLLLIATRFEKD